MDDFERGARFAAAVAEAKRGPYGAGLTVYTAEDYAAARTFLADDERAGIAVRPGGEIVSVFIRRDSAWRGRVGDLLAWARAQGGDHLDCFDIGDLPAKYARSGFVEVDRLTWDDDYAPEGWNYARDGRPDVVIMRAA